MTLKATIAERVLSPDQIRLARARSLFIRTVTEKERQTCELAELRLESAKREFQISGIATRREVRAVADLTDAQTKLLEASERAARIFDEETNK